jgi:hypothetical protein
MRLLFFKFKVLVFRGINRIYPFSYDLTYPQTWPLVISWVAPLRWAAQVFCGLTGHETCAIDDDTWYSEDPELFCRWCSTTLAPSYPGEAVPRRKDLP